MNAPRARNIILCWSPYGKELTFLKTDKAVADIGPAIISPSLRAVLQTALSRETAIIVLRPITSDEHDVVEDFLHKITRQNKVSSHFVIVVSDKGKRFKSGVQSHSVIVTFDEAAIVRAVTHGSSVISEPEPEEDSVTVVKEPDMGPLPRPTLLEYFKLPDFKNTAPLVTKLSSEDREHLALALGELAHAELEVPPGADAIERGAAWARKYRETEVAIVSRAEILRFGPTRSDPIKHDEVPPPGAGALLSAHKLASLLEVDRSMLLHYHWITELDCCLLCWGKSKDNNLFVQALMYTVLRMRKSEKFRMRQSA
jgi:hypothetical protein